MPDDSIDVNIGASVSGSQSFADPSAIPTPGPSGSLSASDMMAQNAAAASAANQASQSARMTADQELSAAYVSRGGSTFTTPGTPFAGERYTGSAFAVGPQTPMGGMANPSAFSGGPSAARLDDDAGGPYQQWRSARADAELDLKNQYVFAGRAGDIGSAQFSRDLAGNYQSAGVGIESDFPVAPMSPFRESFARGGQGWTALGGAALSLISSGAGVYAANNRGVYLTPEQQEQSYLSLAPGIGGAIGGVAGAFTGNPIGGALVGGGIGSGVQQVVGANLEREQSGRIAGQEFANATGSSVAEIRKFTDAIMAAGVATQQVASIMATLSGGPNTTGATASLAIGMSAQLGTLAPAAATSLIRTEGSSPILFPSLGRAQSPQGAEFYAEASIIAEGQGDYSGANDIRPKINPQRHQDIDTVNLYDRDRGTLNPFTGAFWRHAAQGWQNLIHNHAALNAANAARWRLAQPDTLTQDAVTRGRSVAEGMTDIGASLDMGGVDVSRAQSALGAEIFTGASAIDIRRDSGTYTRAVEGEIQGIARGRDLLVQEMRKETDPAHRAMLATWAGQADVSINSLRLQQSQFGAELTESGYAQREANIGVSIARAQAGVVTAQVTSTPGAVSSAQGVEIERLRDLQSQLTEEIRKGIPIYEDRIAKEKELAVTSQQITAATAEQRQQFFASTGANIANSLSAGLTTGSISSITGGNVGGSAYSAQDTSDAMMGVENARTALSRAPVGTQEYYAARRNLAQAHQTAVDATAQIYGFNPSGTDVIGMENAQGNFNVAMQAPFMSGPQSNPFTAYRGMYQALQPLLSGSARSVSAEQNMLSSGRDTQGNVLSADQRAGITQALERDMATYQGYRQQEAEMQRMVMTSFAAALPEASSGAPAGFSLRSIGLSALSSRFLGNGWMSGTWGHDGMTMDSLMHPSQFQPNVPTGGTGGAVAGMAATNSTDARLDALIMAVKDLKNPVVTTGAPQAFTQPLFTQASRSHIDMGKQ